MEAVDDIAANDDRYAQAALLHGGLLHYVYLFGADAVQDGAHLPGGCGFGQIGASGELVHLADFLLEGHLGEQPVDLAVRFALLGAACGHDEDGRPEAECLQYLVHSLFSLSVFLEYSHIVDFEGLRQAGFVHALVAAPVAAPGQVELEAESLVEGPGVLVAP